MKVVTTPGSFFVYQLYEIDSLGIETIVNHIDTMTIQGDTKVNGYIVDQFGTLLYSHFTSNDTVSITQTVYQIKISINQNNPTTVFNLSAGKLNGQTIPSQTVTVLDHQKYYYSPTGSFTNCDTTWIDHTYFVDGIGEVKTQIALHSVQV